jgi:hypothetical protein
VNDRPRVGERSRPQCVYHFGEDFGERSPKGGQTFTSSVSLALPILSEPTNENKNNIK